MGTFRRELLRAVTFPPVWCAVPVMAVLVVAVMPLNEAYYDFVVNYDPQGLIAAGMCIFGVLKTAMMLV
jgi:hypothetical protein